MHVILKIDYIKIISILPLVWENKRVIVGVHKFIRSNFYV